MSSGVHRRSHRVLLMLVALVLAFSSVLVGVASGYGGNHGGGNDGNVDFWLTILHNNDGESDLIAAELPEGGFEGGVDYFASLRWKAHIQGILPFGWGWHHGFAKRGVIFVSSGDNFLASPAFTASLNDGIWYDAIALDRLRYDAIELGNHDFDFGPDVLADFISEGFRRPGRPPYLAANLDYSGEPALQALADDGVLAKSTVVWERGKRVGIIGAVTPNLPFISSPRNVVVDPDVADVVQEQIDVLEARGIDKIILISHLQDVDGDVALAAELTGIDVMVAGGGDELLANADDLLLPSDDPGDIFGPYPIIATSADGKDVPVVTTSGQYGYLGQLAIGFDRHGNVVEVDEDRSGPRRVVSKVVGSDGVRPNRAMQRKVVDPVAVFVDELAANIIGDSEVDLDGRRDPGVRTMETNEGNLIADSQLWQAQQLAATSGVAVPDVALQNGGGIRNDSIIPAGPISLLNTFDMVPFGNFLSVVPDIPRDQFKEILENAVSRTQPGDTPGGTGRFAQVAGFSFSYSATGAAQELDADGNVTVPGTRVQEVMLDGGATIVTGGIVVPGADVHIAITDFLARGGDQYPFRGAPFTNVGVSYQQALANYIVAPATDGGLEGSITAADYPVGGEGRITVLP